MKIDIYNPERRYNIIYADPPWTYQDKGCSGNAAQHYALMRDSDICGLPIQNIAAENCVLFLWATYPNLRKAFEVIEAWGFTYKTIRVGDEGIIRGLPGKNGSISYQSCYAVEFPSWHYGHVCNGKVPSRKGLWVLPECLELVEERQPRIGDRIKMVKDQCLAKKGMTGRIVNISTASLPYGVESEKELIGGHGCAGTCKYGYGHWVAKDDFEVITDSELAAEKIVITHGGKTTTAKLYEGKEVAKTAEANCSPDDEFDFATGAKLAFELLMGEEKKEPPKFDKSMLTTGRFGYMSGGRGWFVVVGDNIVYEKGGYDYVKTFANTGRAPAGYEIKYIVKATAFKYAKTSHEVIWCAPGFDPEKAV